jgi:hypothetical protein
LCNGGGVQVCPAGAGEAAMAFREGKRGASKRGRQADLERAMGIEPTSSAWEAEVMAIIRRPQNR